MSCLLILHTFRSILATTLARVLLSIGRWCFSPQSLLLGSVTWTQRRTSLQLGEPFACPFSNHLARSTNGLFNIAWTIHHLALHAIAQVWQAISFTLQHVRFHAYPQRGRRTYCTAQAPLRHFGTNVCDVIIRNNRDGVGRRDTKKDNKRYRQRPGETQRDRGETKGRQRDTQSPRHSFSCQTSWESTASWCRHGIKPARTAIPLNTYQLLPVNAAPATVKTNSAATPQDNSRTDPKSTRRHIFQDLRQKEVTKKREEEDEEAREA